MNIFLQFNDEAATVQKFPGNNYEIIYADPPWSYTLDRSSAKNKGGSANTHYDTMSLEQLCALPIKDITAKDSLLFLWTTLPTIWQAKPLMEAWGFEYKTAVFTWVKTNKDGDPRRPFIGVGSLTRSNAEVVLAGKKGNRTFKEWRQNNCMSSIVYAPRGQHSKKPDLVRDKIIELVGDRPRIELFARVSAEERLLKTYDGWDVWGNEVKE